MADPGVPLQQGAGRRLPFPPASMRSAPPAKLLRPAYRCRHGIAMAVHRAAKPVNGWIRTALKM